LPALRAPAEFRTVTQVYVIAWRKRLETGIDRGQQPVRAFAAAAPQRRALSRKSIIEASHRSQKSLALIDDCIMETMILEQIHIYLDSIIII
jgi:hypothetical protein